METAEFWKLSWNPPASLSNCYCQQVKRIFGIQTPTLQCFMTATFPIPRCGTCGLCCFRVPEGLADVQLELRSEETHSTSAGMICSPTVDGTCAVSKFARHIIARRLHQIGHLSRSRPPGNQESWLNRMTVELIDDFTHNL